jgi:hypothetical protein
VSGRPTSEPLASWDDDAGQWLCANGMSDDLFGQSEPFSGRWPTSGMTLGGRSYPLPTLAPRTGESESSSSPGLLPTPMTSYSQRDPEDWRNGRPAGNGGRRSQIGDLEVAMKDALLKTPTAQLAVNGGSQHPDKRREGGHGPTLADQVEHELPTASPLLPGSAARDWRSGKSNMMEANARPLNEVVVNFLPTPTAADAKGPNPLERDRDGKPRPRSDDDLPTSVARLLPTPRASDTGTPGRRASEGFRPPLSQVLLPTPMAADGDRASLTMPRGNPTLIGSLLPTPTAMDSHGARNATANRSSVKPATNNDGWTLCDVFWTGDSTPRPSAGGKPSRDGQLPGQLSLDEAVSGFRPDLSNGSWACPPDG